MKKIRYTAWIHCTNSFTTIDGFVTGHAVKQIYVRVVVWDKLSDVAASLNSTCF